MSASLSLAVRLTPITRCLRVLSNLLTSFLGQSKSLFVSENQMNPQAKLLYQYLHETLGVKYMPEVLEVEVPVQNHIVWQNPGVVPDVIFFNQDPLTDYSVPAIRELFTKIAQAMGLDLGKIWFLDNHGRSFMDFLNWLKNQNLVAPIVVMKTDPDIQNFIQNAGSFNWVECFSLQQMLDKNALKKPTWEVLKLLLEKK